MGDLRRQSPAEILKHVAGDLRSLPKTFRDRSGGKASRKTGFSLNAPGGRLVARAIEAGAFSEAKHVFLRTCLEEDKERSPTHWQGTFWVDACMHLLPEVALEWFPHKVDLQSEAVFSAIADLIEREAAKVEKLERSLGVGTEKNPQGPWSKPDGPARWAKRFNCSESTFKRLLDSGKVRYKELTTKLIQIHVDDLPAD